MQEMLEPHVRPGQLGPPSQQTPMLSPTRGSVARLPRISLSRTPAQPVMTARKMANRTETGPRPLAWVRLEQA